MDEELLASVKLFAGNYAPQGYMECNGQELSMSHYQALYALLGNTYGGNYKTTFALPKLTPPADGMKYIICIRGVWPARD